MVRTQVARKVQLFVVTGALLLATCGFVERLAPWRHTCEFCGGRMQPFKYGDPDWFGCDIDECLDCGCMIDRGSREFCARLWAKEIAEARSSSPSRRTPRLSLSGQNAVSPVAPRNRAHAP
ncbi:MAG: hypothetical protein U0992_24920 [Planctomycetaceae bacterium]